ncbi:MAG: hypothetical protein ABTS16_19465 [Candidatus Accumulibacter phosphatis]|uniref:Helix-turn-helix domain-containing protein n=1 Tax=Candidatus Accumulibacter contiguus TaxID=2954381 RepID=A0ABX1TDQ8_9PROT|nr:hypothetical protein [Candidatus Accumulibacter contiguus]NMQ07116.1 hypothetical protein [Candidatus Accumulibacter contiguus]
MTTARDEYRAGVEALALDSLQSLDRPWASAREVSALAGRCWRSIARALLRMASRGIVEVQIVTWRDRQGRCRHSRRYRAATALDIDVFPAWLMPRAVPSPSHVTPKGGAAGSPGLPVERFESHRTMPGATPSMNCSSPCAT